MPPSDASNSVASAVERAVVAAHPDLTVWDVVVIPRQGVVRVLIDREGGVDHAACAAVTSTLAPFRDRYSVEVSSPGIERPLSRPEHFARMVGSTVQVRLREAVAGRTSLSGRLVEADPERIAVEVDGERVEVPLAAVGKSHVVWNPVKTP
jgi:ribosome maturation factor RimP